MMLQVCLWSECGKLHLMIALPTVQLLQRGKILIEGTFFRDVGAGWAGWPGWPIALPDIVEPRSGTPEQTRLARPNKEEAT